MDAVMAKLYWCILGVLLFYPVRVEAMVYPVCPNTSAGSASRGRVFVITHKFACPMVWNQILCRASRVPLSMGFWSVRIAFVTSSVIITRAIGSLESKCLLVQSYLGTALIKYWMH